MNVLYEFKLGHNSVKTAQNICSTNYEVAVDHGTVARCLKNFCLGYCKKLDNLAKSGEPKPGWLDLMAYQPL